MRKVAHIAWVNPAACGQPAFHPTLAVENEALEMIRWAGPFEQDEIAGRQVALKKGVCRMDGPEDEHFAKPLLVVKRLSTRSRYSWSAGHSTDDIGSRWCS